MNARLVLLTFFFIAISACSTAGIGESAPTAALRAAGDSPVRSRSVIRTASLSLEVREPAQTQQKAEALLKSYNGYLENTYQSEDSIRLTLRVPKKGLKAFVEAASELGTVLSKNFSSRDVTERLIDNEARLKNLYELRNRLRALLDKAGKVSELLEIEKELARIQTEIETIENRLARLKNRIEHSLVNLEIRQKPIYGPLGQVGRGIYWLVSKLFVIK